MAPPATETLKPNANKTSTYLSSNRTSVFGSRRRRRRRKTPSSCIPLNSSTDPVRVSKLFRRMQSSIHRFKKSRFCRRFLSRMRDPRIRTRIHELTASCSQIQIVTYGIGSINSEKISRLQLALVLRLKEELGDIATGPIQVFDPVLSAVECAVLVSLGCTIIPNNERCRRKARVPTLFFMPHCYFNHYNNLVRTNWKPARLRRMIVLGNSFRAVERGINYADFGLLCKHLLGIRRHVVEVEMEDWNNIRNFKKFKDEPDFWSGFSHLSWHFFELDDNVDMNRLCK